MEARTSHTSDLLATELESGYESCNPVLKFNNLLQQLEELGETLSVTPLL